MDALARSPRRERQDLAWRAATIFLVAGLLWVIFSDLVLYELVHDRSVVTRLETAKGCTFIALSTLAVFTLVHRTVARLQRVQGTKTAILGSIADGILLVGQGGKVIDANPAALRMLGLRLKSEVVGMGAEDFSRAFRLCYLDGTLVPPQDYLSQQALQGATLDSYQGVFHLASGRHVFIVASSAPVFSQSGEHVELVVSVMHDVTEIAKLDQLRDEFFAAAAHTLKTPLAVVKAHAQLLEARATSEQDRAIARVLDRQCGAMDRLVQNLFVLARVRSGTLQLHPTAVELAPLVAEVAREMGHAARHEVRCDITAAPVVLADRERMGQILRNLVDAAGRSAPPGAPVTLRLDLRGSVARMGVAADRREVPREPSELAMDRVVGEQVNEHLLVASRGRLVPETSGSGESTTWVELGTLQREGHVPA